MRTLPGLLSKLIEFKTLAHNRREIRRAFSWIKVQLRGLPVHIREHTINGSPSLIITTQETREPILWLAAHIDVVFGSPEVFSPKTRGKHLIGRGAYDMKFAVAAYIRLLFDLRHELEEYDFGVMITSDEEIGGKDGVKALLEKGYHSDICFLPDGGSQWSIERAAKGVLRVLVKSEGISSHSSRPWEGRNAIDALLGFLHTLHGYFPSEPCHILDHYHNTMNISVISGGEVINSVPDSASARLDLRFTHESSKEELLGFMEEAKKGYPEIAFQEEDFFNSTNIDMENPFVKVYSEIVKEKFQKDVRFEISHGFSDAQYFTQAGIPALVIRPHGGGLHGEEEWIDVENLEEFYVVLKEFVRRVAEYKAKGLRRFRIIELIRRLLRYLRRMVLLK